ncbi:hypothetical protein BSIN_2213 [Burkholderia singularis]|uniref:Uncharacterized protein n=1 Tax=Burkholderia singularis TaxID=1503053 RepID=A0A238H198_9BURK|nr:hypothetical protein BSIN_2213 [Burkholderia singularis]
MDQRAAGRLSSRNNRAGGAGIGASAAKRLQQTAQAGPTHRAVRAILRTRQARALVRRSKVARSSASSTNPIAPVTTITAASSEWQADHAYLA